MKRGASGLSLVAAVDKPVGMSSHDVVNRCRRIFGERRVGHTGTLDPLASGVLPVLVGPATRLDSFMVGHDKVYDVRIAFGASTTTDDAEGEVLETGTPARELREEEFARLHLAGIVGVQQQMPPAYSAIKRAGRKACDEARSGRVIELEPRQIEIYSAELLGIDEEPEEPNAALVWAVRLHVSKGTYIRSIARDAGRALGCPAHVAALRRCAVGSLCIEDCSSLESMEALGSEYFRAAVDPVPLLGYRAFFARGEALTAVSHGAPIRAGSVELFDVLQRGFEERLCSCTSALRSSCTPPSEGELFSVLAEGRLSALYRWDEVADAFKPACVFQVGVSRGGDL